MRALQAQTGRGKVQSAPPERPRFRPARSKADLKLKGEAPRYRLQMAASASVMERERDQRCTLKRSAAQTGMTRHAKRPALPRRPYVQDMYPVCHKARLDYSMISVTTPDPTVLPPSLIANLSPSSIAIGVISLICITTLSPGMHISVPSGRLRSPVTSVVLK